jgi:ABC-type Zn2+ transport system substrate-binding protein/surface adhesin
MDIYKRHANNLLDSTQQRRREVLTSIRGVHMIAMSVALLLAD